MRVCTQDKELLRNFLVAKTAKDLSLMVSMQLRPARTEPRNGAERAAVSDMESRWTAIPLSDLPASVQAALVKATAADGTGAASVAPCDAASSCESDGADGADGRAGSGVGRAGTALWYSVSVLDVDPKPLHRVPHYRRMDADIASEFTELCERSKRSPR